MLRSAREACGEIDIFVANAGVETGAATAEEDWATSWEVNVMAHVRAFGELRDPWLERGHGRFVSVVSAAGLLTMLGSPAYSVTKHAALAYAEWLSATYGDRGIVVQAVCPQGVDTALLPRTAAGAVVLGDRVISPEAVAEVVVEGLAGRRFLLLPHPEVARYARARAEDPDRWLEGMRRLQGRIDEWEASPRPGGSASGPSP